MRRAVLSVEVIVEVSQVRRQLLAAFEAARRETQARRERAIEARDAYDRFLRQVAVPLVRSLATVLVAERLPFRASTPAGGVRLASDNARDDSLEIFLDTDSDPPHAALRVSRSRGSRLLTDERAIKPDASPDTITEQELLDVLLSSLQPWLER
ncbi:MAG: hypothetical protein FJW23_00300 [Acidimicrobiia bacterium]|nr:hypothetical protein [Acidimicrobiia bacterium]